MTILHQALTRDVLIGLRGSVFAAMTAGLLLGGCAGGADFAYTQISEIPEGQGLVSGPEGEFTLIKYDPSQHTASTADTTASGPAPAQTITPSSGSSGSGPLY